MRPSICKTLHTCVQCGEGFYPKRTQFVTFCSRTCSHARQRADADHRKAAVIQARTVAKEQAKAATQARREAKAQARIITLTCAQCCSPFTTADHRRRKYCSRRCCRKAARVAEGPRSETHRARARRAGVPYEPVDPLDIMRRDRWTCQICRARTPEKLRGTTQPRAPELDHIVPLALKGPHTAANLQCACRSCNLAKGAHWVGQRRLFG